MLRFPKNPTQRAFRLLQLAFIIVPMLAGIDKLYTLSLHWSTYISSIPLTALQQQKDLFMLVMGLIEVILAIGIYARPRLFSTLLSFWLLGVITSLLFSGFYFEATRDLGLFLATRALHQLSLNQT